MTIKHLSVLLLCMHAFTTFAADYRDPAKLLSDFANTNQKTDKPFSYWTDELRNLAQMNQKLRSFGAEIKNAAPGKNPAEFKQIFIKHQRNYTGNVLKVLLVYICLKKIA